MNERQKKVDDFMAKHPSSPSAVFYLTAMLTLSDNISEMRQSATISKQIKSFEKLENDKGANMELIDEIKALMVPDDFTGLKHNVLLDHVLKVIAAHQNRLIEMPIAYGSKVYVPIACEDKEDPTGECRDASVMKFVGVTKRENKTYYILVDENIPFVFEPSMVFATADEAKERAKTLSYEESDACWFSL